MIIYFAGGIRGGGGDPELYSKIIKVIEEFGDVATSHLANPKVQKNKLKDIDDSAIYITDMNEIKRCDILVTEVSAPSLGVGYKIAKAEFLGMPVIALFSAKSQYMLSALIAGNSHINIIRYESMEDIKNGLEKLFNGKYSFLYEAP